MHPLLVRLLSENPITKEIGCTLVIQRSLTFRMATVSPLWESVFLHRLCTVCLLFKEPAPQYVPFPLSDICRRALSKEVHVADRKQVNGVGANWNLIAVVCCSVSELDCCHTVHEMSCVWVAQGGDVFFHSIFLF